MQSRKVMLGVFSAIVSMFITLYAGLLWFNNIFISLHWNPISGSLKDYKGLGTYFDYPFIDECLNWATIDLSTVTTAIPFFGFMFISIGLIKIIYYNRRDEQFFTSETFPFSTSFLQIFLGISNLTGTSRRMVARVLENRASSSPSIKRFKILSVKPSFRISSGFFFIT